MATRKDILDKYLSQIVDIPTIPPVVIRLMEKIHQPNPKIEELADLVMTDQVLTTRMLKMVNSVFWGLNRELSSVKEAIIYLGLREISNLVYSVSLTNSFNKDTTYLKRIPFWEHSFGCALFSRIIAKQFGYPDTELAYLGGLLHDVGESILALHFPGEFEHVVLLVKNHRLNFYQAEEKVLGINHTDLGNWMTDTWSIPQSISNVISYHHNIDAVPEDQMLVYIIRMADLVCLYHRLDFGYDEREGITSELVSVWRSLAQFQKNPMKVNMKSYLDAFNAEIDKVKQMVKKVYDFG